MTDLGMFFIGGGIAIGCYFLGVGLDALGEHIAEGMKKDDQ